MQGNLLELPDDQILIVQRDEVAKVKPELFIDGTFHKKVSVIHVY
jgi:hypothetical protein